MLNLFLLLTLKSQDLGVIGDPNIKSGLGPFSNISFFSIGIVGSSLSNTASKILGVLTICASLWFIVQFVVGAFKWLASGGEKQNIESAKEHITHAFIGLAIIVIAYVLTALIGTILGIDILNPQNYIPKLGP